MSSFTVGLTTGVFDLFHIGHLNILERARSRCERLVVGVSSDELVVHLKGRPPVIPLEDRMRIIASLRIVDQVVEETEDDKRALALSVGATAIFKGSDWEGSEKWRRLGPRLASEGISIVFLPYTETISTTSILQRARQVAPR